MTTDLSGFDTPSHEYKLSDESKINIGGRGKPPVWYIEVKNRIRALRAEHPDWRIASELVRFEPGLQGYCVMKATISVPQIIADGAVADAGAAVAAILGTDGLDFAKKSELIRLILQPTVGHVQYFTIAEAHAQEYVETLKSGISYADMIQKAETSAIGRACALAGYGTEDGKEFAVEAAREAEGRYPGVDSGSKEGPRASNPPSSPPSHPVFSEGLVPRPATLGATDWAVTIFGFESEEKKNHLDVAKVQAKVRDANCIAAFKDALGFTPEDKIQRVDMAARLYAYYSVPQRPALGDLISSLVGA